MINHKATKHQASKLFSQKRKWTLTRQGINTSFRLKASTSRKTIILLWDAFERMMNTNCGSMCMWSTIYFSRNNIVFTVSIKGTKLNSLMFSDLSILIAQLASHLFETRFTFKTRVFWEFFLTTWVPLFYTTAKNNNILFAVHIFELVPLNDCKEVCTTFLKFAWLRDSTQQFSSLFDPIKWNVTKNTFCCNTVKSRPTTTTSLPPLLMIFTAAYFLKKKLTQSFDFNYEILLNTTNPISNTATFCWTNGGRIYGFFIVTSISNCLLQRLWQLYK